MDLISFLSHLLPLTDVQKRDIDYAFDYQEYPKGTIFLNPNNNSKKLIFLEKGLYRTFYFNKDKDITHHFWLENSFNCALESIYFNIPAPYGWEAIEVCQVRTISFYEFRQIIESIDESRKFSEMLLIEMIKVLNERLNALQFQSAEIRYEEMLKSCPTIIHRAPLGHIASYIGITQQTLSVIRRGNK